MKKRVFIAMHYLEIGGAETSLIGFLHSFDYTRYDVDLFLYAHQGEMMKYIPPQVRLLPEETRYKHIEAPLKQVIKAGDFPIALARLWGKLQYRNYVRRCHPDDGSAVFQYVQDAVCPFLPSLEKYGEYDVAISFLTPHRIVLDKVKARKKFAWIHTDYSKIDVNVAQELPVWARYDRIISISEEVSKAFLTVFPTLSKKICQIENVLSKELVSLRAKEQKINFPSEKDRINLLSVGRFSYAKNYDNVPDICKRIREKGINAYWYIIGYGGDESLIRQRIEEAGMADHVLLLGKKENPYPYIQACDMYAQPSRYEGKSVTVREAQLLGKPVVITDFPTAQSQIVSGHDGMIVPLDNEACAQAFVDFMQNRSLQLSIVENLKHGDFANEKEIEKLYTIIDKE